MGTSKRVVVATLASLTLFTIGILFLLPRSRLNDADRPVFERIARDLADAQLVVYEGLPHQESEAELLASEVASKETILIENFRFYKRPMTISAETIERLRYYCRSRSTFHSPGDAKACIGFHPDYCLAWSNGPRVSRFLLCLGCGDAVIISDTVRLNLDFEGNHGPFGQFLTTLREQRPEPL